MCKTAQKNGPINISYYYYIDIEDINVMRMLCKTLC